MIDGWLAVPLSCVLVVLHFQQAAECLLAICIQWPPAPSCAERRSLLHCQYPPHIETLSLLSARQARHPDSSVVWPRCRDTASLPSSFSPRWMAPLVRPIVKWPSAAPLPALISLEDKHLGPTLPSTLLWRFRRTSTPADECSTSGPLYHPEWSSNTLTRASLESPLTHHHLAVQQGCPPRG